MSRKKESRDTGGGRPPRLRQGAEPLDWSRRRFNTALTAGLAAVTSLAGAARSQTAGERPLRRAENVEVLNPRTRVPVSLIIDDSTCLVNLAHFAIPQFAEVFPQRYLQDWKSLPREIPDSFVRTFGEWSAETGVKGKYSIVPFPACVGWIDRDLPGWSRQELEASLDLVRTLLLPNWDIHPEMVTHTWGIDTATGRPYPDRTEANMENWGFSAGKSVDFLTDYMAYALRLLKNVGLPCEGITTPGGFGNRVLPELAQASLRACRDVFRAEIPHYFRHLYTDDTSVAPRVEYAGGLEGADPECVVSIIGCTGDWFGGWDGLTPGSIDRLITANGRGGRLPEVIARGEPAIMVCHWPGIYYNGDLVGYRILQGAVQRLHASHDNVIWMKLSEIARYWAARELTRIEWLDNGLRLRAPFAAASFTLSIAGRAAAGLTCEAAGTEVVLKQIERVAGLRSGTWVQQRERLLCCFDLPRGESELRLQV